MSVLEVGAKAPDFSLPDENGQQVSLEEYAGKFLVLYFYPKDSTPGCTIEANDFSGLKSEFDKAGAAILGVSKDSLKRHQNFIAKNDLTIRLLSDQDNDMIERYGLWVEKKMYGKTYMGIERATLLIGPDGKILEAWRKVKVKGHAKAVLDRLLEFEG